VLQQGRALLGVSTGTLACAPACAQACRLDA
jgi:hypothetical protein